MKKLKIIISPLLQLLGFKALSQGQCSVRDLYIKKVKFKNQQKNFKSKSAHLQNIFKEFT